MKAAYSPPKNIVRWRNVGSLFIIICFRILSWHWACKSLTVFPAGGYKSAHWWSLMAPVPESVMRLIYKPVLICVGIRCSGPKVWLFVIQMSGRNHFGRTSSNKLGRVYYLLYFLWIRFDEWNDGRFARFIRLNAFSSKAMIKCAWQVFWLVSVVDAFPEECSSGIEGDCLQHCEKLTAAGLFRIYTWFPFNPQLSETNFRKYSINSIITQLQMLVKICIKTCTQWAQVLQSNISAYNFP